MVKKISANIGAIDVGAFGLMFDGIGGPINPSIHDVLITNVFGVPFLTYLLVFPLLVIVFLLLLQIKKKMIGIIVGVASIN
jgi:hypothetical protein